MNRDYADEQVRGLERYIPTKFSQGMLIALLTVPFGSFWLIHDLLQKLMPNQTGETLLVASVGLSISIALVISIAMLVELSLVIRQSKHRRITHHSNVHPNMSFSWLWDNASSKHVIFLASVFLMGVVLGVML
ncbi:hypothetical protein [Photobacterium damselae]|uniref:hypothetical protein n=1 Tax=Photobacterium damselae TaxID=38293 RepID=UPI0040687CFA